MRSYPETWVTYRGQTFASPAYRDVPAQYLIVTDDAGAAKAKGLKKAPAAERYGYERWVRATDVERVVRRFAHGLYRGVQVAVLSETDSGFVIEADRMLPGLEQLEPTVHRGLVPAAALERVWTEEVEMG